MKGGRIGGARALLGQVLSIKPLLELKDGIVAEAGRQRTKARALAAIADVARSHQPIRRLALVHGDSPEVEHLEALITDITTEFPIIVTDMGPVVGTHGGPGIIALCWITKSTDDRDVAEGAANPSPHGCGAGDGFLSGTH